MLLCAYNNQMQTTYTILAVVVLGVRADAVDGDQEARAMIFNRLLGKVPDEVNLKGEGNLFPHLSDEELMKKYTRAVLGGPEKPSSGA